MHLFTFMYSLDFKKNYSHLIDSQPVSQATQFLLQVQNLTFEELPMKTAAGTSLLFHAWEKAVFNQHWFFLLFTN